MGSRNIIFKMSAYGICSYKIQDWPSSEQLGESSEQSQSINIAYTVLKAVIISFAGKHILRRSCQLLHKHLWHSVSGFWLCIYRLAPS